MKLEPLLECLSFTEAPRWRDGRLYFSDVYTKAGGAVTHSLELSPRAAYACMLGGVDRKTLFVLTNTGSGPSMAQKRDGRIETMRVDVPGVGWP